MSTHGKRQPVLVPWRPWYILWLMHTLLQMLSPCFKQTSFRYWSCFSGSWECCQVDCWFNIICSPTWATGIFEIKNKVDKVDETTGLKSCPEDISFLNFVVQWIVSPSTGVLLPCQIFHFNFVWNFPDTYMMWPQTKSLRWNLHRTQPLIVEPPEPF